MSRGDQMSEFEEKKRVPSLEELRSRVNEINEVNANYVDSNVSVIYQTSDQKPMRLSSFNAARYLDILDKRKKVAFILLAVDLFVVILSLFGIGYLTSMFRNVDKIFFVFSILDIPAFVGSLVLFGVCSDIYLRAKVFNRPKEPTKKVFLFSIVLTVFSTLILFFVTVPCIFLA